ncbi:kelch-like protein 10 [Paramormyrops kingsleyae]|uniref:kelch-like protein 10 n=1 Tax=Paramormyrops kingsleyae TaxID=1676925 RepID=UPI003B9750C6
MEPEILSQSFKIFNDLRLKGALCDVEFVANGVNFKAHKIIMCGCSSYFETLFTSGWNVKGKREYVIPGISSEALGLIIEYAYTHTVPITVDNVESLLTAADQLDIPEILQTCSDFLEDQLCADNCIGICRIADVCYCPKLHQSAFRFILENFTEVASTSEEFLELSLPQLCDIIERDELNVRQEDVVFDAILRWVMHEPASRKAHISMLLPKVRMARMNIEDFMRTVKNNDLVKASEECRVIISEVLKSIYELEINVPPYSDFQNPLTRPRLPSAILLATGGSTDSPVNGIEAYDTRVDRWLDVTQEGDIPCAYHGVVYLKGFVYYIGGCYDGTCLNTVSKFNPITRTWHQVAPMLSRRCEVSVATLDGYIYAMGGFDGHGDLKTAERYDPETNKWSLIKPMNDWRSDASATTIHGKVYICGGFNGIEFLSTAECYDPLTDQWTTIAPMRTARHGLGVIAFNDKIYAVGGSNGLESLQCVEAYDPLTDRWRAMAPMFTPRCNFGIEVVDDLLFVVGGFDGFKSTTKVECYDAETGSWYRAHDMGIPRSGLSCCVVPALPSIVEYAAPRESLMSTQ